MYQMNLRVLQILHDEHLTTLGLLDRFDRVLKKVGPSGAPDRAMPRRPSYWPM